MCPEMAEPIKSTLERIAGGCNLSRPIASLTEANSRLTLAYASATQLRLTIPAGLIEFVHPGIDSGRFNLRSPRAPRY